MSTITLQYNIINKQWKGVEHSLTSNYCKLQLGFRSNVPLVVFDNLTFGFELKTTGKSIQIHKFPENEHIVYRSSSEPYLVIVPLNLEPSTKYILSVWAENAGTRRDFDYKFSTPALTDTGDYVNASVPYPDPNDYQKYVFDIATRQWVKK